MSVVFFKIKIRLILMQVTTLAEDLADDGDVKEFALGSAGISNDDMDDSNSTEMADDDGALELVHVNEDFFYMAHVMRLAALLHSLASLAMLIAYYHLKVPLAIFKREKEIARRLEFDGLYIVEQPEDDDIKSHWDKLVISAKYVLRFISMAQPNTHNIIHAYLYTYDVYLIRYYYIVNRSFPVNYWDKFAKKKVRQKYSETYDFDSISNLLGMEKTSFSTQENEERSGLINL